MCSIEVEEACSFHETTFRLLKLVSE